MKPSHMLDLDPWTTALVVIDLQRGMLGAPTTPFAVSDVIARSARLADAFRARGATVVLVRFDPGSDGILFPYPRTDIEHPRLAMPREAVEIVPELGPKAGDVVITKHQPSAFFATDLEVQLRRRKIETIVLCGIATNIGVESTARTAFEHGFHSVFAADALSALDEELHTAAVRKYFPTIGRVRTVDEILSAVDAVR